MLELSVDRHGKSPAIVRVESISRQARRARAERDPLFFHHYYLGHYITRDPCDMHEWMAATNRKAANFGLRCIDIGAPQLAKSVLRSREYPIYCLCFDKRHHIALLGNPRSVGESMAGILREIEENHRLLEDYGEKLAVKKDAKKQFVAYRDSEVVFKTGATIRALTMEQTLRGALSGTARVDTLVVDDPQDVRRLENPELRRKDIATFRGEFLGTLAPSASCMIVVNNLHPGMIARELARTGDWEVRFWPVEGEIDFDATRNRVTHVPGAPRFFTADEITQRRKDKGSALFDRDDLCLDIDEGGAVFDMRKATRFSSSRVTWNATHRVVDGDLVTFSAIALDPSSGFDKGRPRWERKGEVDYAPVLVGARGASGRVYVLRATMLRDTAESDESITTIQARVTAKEFQAHSTDSVVVENVGFQKLVCDAVRDQIKAITGLEVTPKGEPQSIRKETRILSLQGPIERGELRFADDLPAEYFDQFDAFRLDGSAPHDDAPDATEILWRNLKGKAMGWAF
jgi:predicted phage terminase large subunit-like protein